VSLKDSDVVSASACVDCRRQAGDACADDDDPFHERKEKPWPPPGTVIAPAGLRLLRMPALTTSSAPLINPGFLSHACLLPSLQSRPDRCTYPGFAELPQSKHGFRLELANNVHSLPLDGQPESIKELSRLFDFNVC
jgi:hypothetical protein